MNQLPEGPTKHTVELSCDGVEWAPAAEVEGRTKTGDTLSVPLVPGLAPARYLRVTTTESPSWVAWQRIRPLFDERVRRPFSLSLGWRRRLKLACSRPFQHVWFLSAVLFEVSRQRKKEHKRLCRVADHQERPIRARSPSPAGISRAVPVVCPRELGGAPPAGQAAPVRQVGRGGGGGAAGCGHRGAPGSGEPAGRDGCEGGAGADAEGAHSPLRHEAIRSDTHTLTGFSVICAWPREVMLMGLLRAAGGC